MALRWIEGFELFGTSTDIDTTLGYKYPSFISTITDYDISSVVRYASGSGQSLLVESISDFYLETPTLSAQSHWFIGFAFNVSDTESSFKPVFKLVDENGDVQVRINCGTGLTPAFNVYRGDNTSLLGTTQVFALSEWHYAEFEIVIDNSTGIVRSWLNGVQDLNLTGLDTQQSAIATADKGQMWLGWGDTNSDLYLDDWYMCDNTGSTNNSRLGNVRIEGLLPAGAGNSAQWTPDSGSNYDRVNEATADADTSYVESQTVSEKDTYTFDNLTDINSNILGVQVSAIARLSDTDVAPDFRTVARSNGIESTGNTHTLNSTTYSCKADVFETDPDTGSAWTDTAVNAAEFGVETV